MDATQRGYERHAFVDTEQGDVEDEVTDGCHTVSTCFKEGHKSDGKRISVSTSHNFNLENFFRIYYSDDLRGGVFCSLHACHKFGQESMLTASYQTGSSSDPMMEVELQYEKGSFKGTGKMERNLTNGYQQVYMQSETVLSAEFLSRNSFVTDFRNHGFLGLEFTVATQRCPSFSSSLLLGLNGSKELSVQCSQSMGNHTVAEVSAYTNFTGLRSISFEAKHEVSERINISQKLRSWCVSIFEFMIKASETDSWKWRYRNESSNRHALELEWRHKVSSSDYYLLDITAKIQGLSVHAELCHLL